MTAASQLKTILLVDDDEDDAKLHLFAFQQYNLPYKLVVVHDGIEALEYLTGTGVHVGRDPSQRPALVLLDLNMPRLNGFETLEKIRAHPVLNDLPVAILTSSQDSQDQERALRLAAKAFLHKPTIKESEQFVRQVEGLLSD